MRPRKKFLWVKESFVDWNKFSLITRNRFVYTEKKIFKSTKFFSIQRNFILNRILGSQKILVPKNFGISKRFG